MHRRDGVVCGNESESGHSPRVLAKLVQPRKQTSRMLGPRALLCTAARRLRARYSECCKVREWRL
jgi:hypothetical protein